MTRRAALHLNAALALASALSACTPRPPADTLDLQALGEVPAAPGETVAPDPARLGLTWVTLPEGRFVMGSDDGFPDQRPAHEVRLPAFELMRSEVTVAMYRTCVEAGICGEYRMSGQPGCNWGVAGREDHPINCASWFDARTFCTWLGLRLPSEAEWEYAARSAGGAQDQPWGDAPADCDHAVLDEGGKGCGGAGTAAVCSRPAGRSGQGACDLAGNVAEWVEDCWQDSYADAPSDGSPRRRCDGPTGFQRVARGGSHSSGSPAALRARARAGAPPADSLPSHGFRCARHLP